MRSLLLKSACSAYLMPIYFADLLHLRELSMSVLMESLWWSLPLVRYAKAINFVRALVSHDRHLSLSHPLSLFAFPFPTISPFPAPPLNIRILHPPGWSKLWNESSSRQLTPFFGVWTHVCMLLISWTLNIMSSHTGKASLTGCSKGYLCIFSKTKSIYIYTDINE